MCIYYSSWKTIEGAIEKIQNIPLDFNDDFFLYYKDSDHTIKLWEYYEVHESRPKKLLPYGTWTIDAGLQQLPPTKKWERRGNLEVFNSLLSLTIDLMKVENQLNNF